MTAIAAALGKANISVTLVALDPALADDAAHEAKFRKALGAGYELGQTTIGGFSLGGRIAARLCAELAPRGLLCIGYPFHRVKAPTETHGLEALSGLRLPIRIIQGTRDKHGSATEIKGYRLPDSVEVVWIEDGNHRLVPRERSGHTYEEHVATAAASALAFVRRSG